MDLVLEEKKSQIVGKNVSFSQYSLYTKCPYAWKLAYIDKLKTYKDSIHTIFGTSIHEVLQEYIKILYTQGAPFADDYDIIDDFKNKFKNLFDESVKKENIDDSLTINNFNEFTQDGLEILNWLTKINNRNKHFPSKAYELVGIEFPLEINVGNNLKYVGFLDIVLKDKKTNNIKILDLKTSTNGWRAYAKKDVGKTDQLLLYKKFYSELLNIPFENIEVEFLILKRKLIQDFQYTQNRVSIFEPANGKGSVKKAEERFNKFLNEGFTSDGQYNINKAFKKTPGNKKANCRFCEFYNTSHCNSIED